MLVLSRKVGERLVIGDNITVVINRIAGNRITLGIEAPSDVHIVRGELKEIRDGFADDSPQCLGAPVQVDEHSSLLAAKAER